MYQIGGPALPSSSGELSKVVSSKAIREANKAVERTLTEGSSGKRRQEYQKVSIEMKNKIAKYAVENGVKSAVEKFKNQVPNAPPNWKNTVKDWKDAYLRELKRKRAAGGDISDMVLQPPKRGRPLLLGVELDKKVQEYIKRLRSGHAVVNSSIVKALAEGIVSGCDPTLLSSNGGPITISKDWAKGIMERMGLSKRKSTTKSTLSKYDFNKVCSTYLNDILTIVLMEEVPLPLVINWDQTGVNFVQVSEWTLEEKGSKRVEIAGLHDKRQMTVVLAGCATGDLLPPQLTYSGLTSKSLPKNVTFPVGWDITTTPTHWSSEDSMLQYIHKIICPYVAQKRVQLKLGVDFPALVLFDHFGGEITQKVFDLLEENNINFVLIPRTCTDRLQPMDLSVNKPFKAHLKQSFHTWYASQIKKQIEDNEDSSLSC